MTDQAPVSTVEPPTPAVRYAAQCIVPEGAAPELVDRKRRAVERHLDKALQRNPGRVVDRKVWPSMTDNGDEACYRGYVDIEPDR